MTNFPIDTFNKATTPFYAYDLNRLQNTLNTCKEEASKYNFHVHYALKANSNPRVLQLISGLGFGADCVSGNEVKAAVHNGFSKTDVVFAGVGKSDDEINAALDLDIACFNVESIQELEVINELAAVKNKVAKIALRLNPNVNPYTHAYITTGLDENKFGIDTQELNKLVDLFQQLKNVDLIGIHFHIGSQITRLEAFKNLCTRVNELNKWFQEHRIDLKIINVGGGLGIDYENPDANPTPDFANYFEIFNQFLELLPSQEVHFELGRSLVAQFGSLISKVLYVKPGRKTDFMILDAGMTELLRPALYQAYHKVDVLTPTSENTAIYDVVGPVCESSDCFGKAQKLPTVERGSLVALRSAGAYGEVMANNYNLRELNEPIFF